MTAKPPPRGIPWMLVAATVVLAIAGATAVIVGATLRSATVASPATAPAPADGSPAANGDAGVPEPSPSAVGAGIADLADPDWVSGVSESGGIPDRALRAYAGAATSIARTQPECGLGWNTLAAIGLVESEHGSIDGAVLGADGAVRPPVVGIPLDGNGTIPVPDTDRGEWDGDAQWDRALGPMQFIPQTWRDFSQDGNGDGDADVHNIDDAALTAAHYLCADGRNLADPAGWISAINTYNPSIEYNNRVAEAATAYAALP